MSLRSDWSTERVPGQTGLHTETLGLETYKHTHTHTHKHTHTEEKKHKQSKNPKVCEGEPNNYIYTINTF